MVTSYNLEDYINDCIQSVVGQTMPCNWELLIGDDGSTDGTVGIIKKWIDRYPQNIILYQWTKDDTHAMNGFSAAANRAKLLERASGDYLIFLDGDDKWLGTTKLIRQYEVLEMPENKDCSCVAHNTYKYSLDTLSGYNMTKDLPDASKLSLDDYWTTQYFHTNTLLFRKECKQLLLDDVYKGYLNDLFITFCALQFGKVYYIDEAWNQYNITGKGLFTGAPRIYSLFRGMHLFDLERRIAPHKHRLILRGQWFNILKIIRNYKQKDKGLVKPLVEDLDPIIFPYTTLLAKCPSLSLKERICKCSLALECIIIGVFCKITKMIR